MYLNYIFMHSYTGTYLALAAKFCNIRVTQVVTALKKTWRPTKTCHCEVELEFLRTAQEKDPSSFGDDHAMYVTVTRNTSHNEMEPVGV